MLGTANTMCCLAEAMGMALPGTAAIPAVYSQRMQAAFNSGYAVVDLVKKNIKPRDVVNRKTIETPFALTRQSADPPTPFCICLLSPMKHESTLPLMISEKQLSKLRTW